MNERTSERTIIQWHARYETK